MKNVESDSFRLERSLSPTVNILLFHFSKSSKKLSTDFNESMMFPSSGIPCHYVLNCLAVSKPKRYFKNRLLVCRGNYLEAK